MRGAFLTAVVTRNFESMTHRDGDLLGSYSVGRWVTSPKIEGPEGRLPITRFVFPQYSAVLPLLDGDMLIWDAQKHHNGTTPISEAAYRKKGAMVYASAMYMKQIVQTAAIKQM